MFWGNLDRLVRNPQGLVGLGILLLLIFAAALAPLITWHGPNVQDAEARFLAPGWEHSFGTDELRRDLYARTVYGLRISLGIAIVAVSVGATLGIVLGFMSGYIAGFADAVIMRVVDAPLVFPGLLAALAIVTILGPGTRNVGIAIAFFSIPSPYHRSPGLRAQMLAERNREYVFSAVALGAGPLRVVFRHSTPNAIPPLPTQLALLMAAAVILSASLSFLGLGESPQHPRSGARSTVRRPTCRTPGGTPPSRAPCLRHCSSP